MKKEIGTIALLSLALTLAGTVACTSPSNRLAQRTLDAQDFAEKQKVEHMDANNRIYDSELASGDTDNKMGACM